MYQLRSKKMELNTKMLQTKITKFCDLEKLTQDLHDKELKCISLRKEFQTKIIKLEKYNEKMIVAMILQNDKQIHKKSRASKILLEKFYEKSKGLSTNIWRLQRRQEEIEKNQNKLAKEISNFTELIRSKNINSLEYAQMVASEINKVYGKELEPYIIETRNLLSFSSKSESQLYKVNVTILATKEMIERIKKFDGKISVKQIEKIERTINNQDNNNCPKLYGDFIIVEKQADRKINCIKKLFKNENISELKNIKNLTILEKIIKNQEKMQKNTENFDNFEINYSIN